MKLKINQKDKADISKKFKTMRQYEIAAEYGITRSYVGLILMEFYSREEIEKIKKEHLESKKVKHFCKWCHKVEVVDKSFCSDKCRHAHHRSIFGAPVDDKEYQKHRYNKILEATKKGYYTHKEARLKKMKEYASSHREDINKKTREKYWSGPKEREKQKRLAKINYLKKKALCTNC